MARVVMFTYGSDSERTVRRAFAAAGHDFRPIEPDMPQAQANVDHANPEAILLDLGTRPSHVRETAAFVAGSKRYREAPVFVVSEDPQDLGRVTGRIPRARHASPEGCLAAVEAALAGAE